MGQKRARLAFFFAPALSLFVAGCFPVRYIPFEARTGVVVERQSLKPVQGAHVFQCSFCWTTDLLQTPCAESRNIRETTTDENGRFTFEERREWTAGSLVPDGMPGKCRTNLRVEADGYEPGEIIRGDRRLTDGTPLQVGLTRRRPK